MTSSILSRSSFLPVQQPCARPPLPVRQRVLAPRVSCRGLGDHSSTAPLRSVRQPRTKPSTPGPATWVARCTSSAGTASPSPDVLESVKHVAFGFSWIWGLSVLATLLASACPYSGDPITIFWYSWVFLVPQLGFWTRFAFTGTLANCILSALCSFFKLGDLLNRAWIPAVSGGMTMTSARLHVMAQYLGCAAAALMGAHLLVKFYAAALAAAEKQEAKAKKEALKHVQADVQKRQQSDKELGTSGTNSMAAVAALDGQQGQAAAATSRQSADQLQQTSAFGEHSTAGQPAMSPSQGTPQDSTPVSNGDLQPITASQTDDAGSSMSLPEASSSGEGATSDLSTKAVPHQKDVGAAGASGSEQTYTVTAVPTAGQTAQRPSGSAQQGSAQGNAAAAAHSPQKLPAGNDSTEYDQLAALLLSRKSPTETSKNMRSWRPYLARMEGSTLRCLAVTQAELAQHAPPVITARDKLAVSDGPSCGKVDGPISSSSDIMDAGSSEGSNLPLLGPSEEAFGMAQDLLAQHAGLVRERDSLHLGVKILSEQLKSRAAHADLQQAKLGAKIQQLSEQLFSQQDAEGSAELEVKNLRVQLKFREKHFAAALQEKNELHSRVMGLTADLSNRSADAMLQHAKLSTENQKLTGQLSSQRKARESAEGEVKSLREQHAAVEHERDSLHVGVKILRDQLKSQSAQADLQQAEIGAEIRQLSGQLSWQLSAQESAQGELQSLQHQLESLQEQHAAVVQERDSLHELVVGLRNELNSLPAHADQQKEANLGAEIQQLSGHWANFEDPHCSSEPPQHASAVGLGAEPCVTEPASATAAADGSVASQAGDLENAGPSQVAVAASKASAEATSAGTSATTMAAGPGGIRLAAEAKQESDCGMTDADLAVLQRAFWNWRGAAALCQQEGFSAHLLAHAVSAATEARLGLQAAACRANDFPVPQDHAYRRAIIDTEQPYDAEPPYVTCWLLIPREWPGVPSMPDSELAGAFEWWQYATNHWEGHERCIEVQPHTLRSPPSAGGHGNAEPPQPLALAAPAAGDTMAVPNPEHDHGTVTSAQNDHGTATSAEDAAAHGVAPPADAQAASTSNADTAQQVSPSGALTSALSFFPARLAKQMPTPGAASDGPILSAAGVSESGSLSADLARSSSQEAAEAEHSDEGASAVPTHHAPGDVDTKGPISSRQGNGSPAPEGPATTLIFASLVPSFDMWTPSFSEFTEQACKQQSHDQTELSEPSTASAAADMLDGGGSAAFPKHAPGDVDTQGLTSHEDIDSAPKSPTPALISASLVPSFDMWTPSFSEVNEQVGKQQSHDQAEILGPSHEAPAASLAPRTSLASGTAPPIKDRATDSPTGQSTAAPPGAPSTADIMGAEENDASDIQQNGHPAAAGATSAGNAWSARSDASNGDDHDDDGAVEVEWGSTTRETSAMLEAPLSAANSLTHAPPPTTETPLLITDPASDAVFKDGGGTQFARVQQADPTRPTAESAAYDQMAASLQASHLEQAERDVAITWSSSPDKNDDADNGDGNSLAPYADVNAAASASVHPIPSEDPTAGLRSDDSPTDPLQVHARAVSGAPKFQADDVAAGIVSAAAQLNEPAGVDVDIAWDSSDDNNNVGATLGAVPNAVEPSSDGTPYSMKVETSEAPSAAHTTQPGIHAATTDCPSAEQPAAADDETQSAYGHEHAERDIPIAWGSSDEGEADSGNSFAAQTGDVTQTASAQQASAVIAGAGDHTPAASSDDATWNGAAASQPGVTDDCLSAKPHVKDESLPEYLQPDPTLAAVEAARQHAATAVALAAKALQQTSRVQMPEGAAPELTGHAPAAAAAEGHSRSAADDYSNYAAAAEAAGDGTAWHDHTASSAGASADDDAAVAADAAVAEALHAAAASGRQAELDARTIAMTAEIAAKSAAMAAITDAKAALAKARAPRPTFDGTGKQDGPLL